jgi:hypothetical protein
MFYRSEKNPVSGNRGTLDSIEVERVKGIEPSSRFRKANDSKIKQ